MFLTFSLFARRTPWNVFMWIHPQCYHPVFYQRKRFGELDFGRYREFLVSVRVVADLEGRVGCWKYFLFTILQKVLLQLHDCCKARYFPDTVGVVPVFVGNDETTQNTFRDWLVQFSGVFFRQRFSK